MLGVVISVALAIWLGAELEHKQNLVGDGEIRLQYDVHQLIHEQNKTRHSSDKSSDNCSQHTNTNTMPNYKIGVVDTSRVDSRLPRCVPI